MVDKFFTDCQTATCKVKWILSSHQHLSLYIFFLPDLSYLLFYTGYLKQYHVYCVQLGKVYLIFIPQNPNLATEGCFSRKNPLYS